MSDEKEAAVRRPRPCVSRRDRGERGMSAEKWLYVASIVACGLMLGLALTVR